MIHEPSHFMDQVFWLTGAKKRGLIHEIHEESYTPLPLEQNERLETMERPSFIPQHATNVRNIKGNLWAWEFSGGAALYIGFDVQGMGRGPTIALNHELLSGLLDDLIPQVDRYRQAIAAEKARIAGYDAYLEGIEYQEEE